MRTLVRWSNSSRKKTTLKPRQGEPSRCACWRSLVLEIAVVDRVEARLLDRQPPQRAAGIDHGGGGLRRARRLRSAAGTGRDRPVSTARTPGTAASFSASPSPVGLDLDVIAAAQHLAGQLRHRADQRDAAGLEQRHPVAHALHAVRAGATTAAPRRRRCLSERIISSNSAVACGSRPEVGSSRIAIGDVLHQDFGEAEPLPHAAREGADPLLPRRRRGRRDRAPPRFACRARPPRCRSAPPCSADCRAAVMWS